MKGTKYRAGGGGMKGTKYRAGGGGMKGTKGFAKGGAALMSEMKANPGVGNMPASVRMALGGDIAKIKSTKGMAKGGAMNKKKAYAKGGRVAMYNVGGMVKSSGDLNTGIARPKNTYK